MKIEFTGSEEPTVGDVPRGTVFTNGGKPEIDFTYMKTEERDSSTESPINAVNLSTGKYVSLDPSIKVIIHRQASLKIPKQCK